MNFMEYLGRGIAHERAGQPCQDFAAYRQCKNGNCIMALSDGASSAKQAETASRTNVEAIFRLFDGISLKNFLKKSAEEQVDAILASCREVLRERAKHARDSSTRDYAATLLFAVFDDSRLLTAHLGDGAIFGADKHGRLCFVSDPDNFEQQTNRTYFTVSGDADEHLRLNVHDMRGITGLVMTSDGAYTMFKNRGDGEPSATALELMQYAAAGEMASHAELADVLNQMAEVPMERLDDWSVLVWDRRQRARGESIPEISSMLAEETAKYAEEPQPAATPVPAPAPVQDSEPDDEVKAGRKLFSSYTPKHLKKKAETAASTRTVDIRFRAGRLKIDLGSKSEKDGD